MVSVRSMDHRGLSFEEVQSSKWTILHLEHPVAVQNQGSRAVGPYFLGYSVRTLEFVYSQTSFCEVRSPQPPGAAILAPLLSVTNPLSCADWSFRFKLPLISFCL